MGIQTYCAFNYGHVITAQNQNINFSEGAGPELLAEIEIGSYTLGEFIGAVSTALNKVGDLEYTCSLDRTTRKITISADGVFSLLNGTGTHVNISAFQLIGFTDGIDRTGTTTYEANDPSGQQYVPQFLLQSFVDYEDEQQKASSNLNQSATGVIQVTSYGQLKFMSCNITLATDSIPQVAIRENPSGVLELRKFMEAATDKSRIEFIYDIENQENYVSTVLESTPESGQGTGFRLKELYSRNLFGYYETGILKFRKL